VLTDYVRALRGLNRNVRLYLFTTALLGFTIFGGIYPVLFNLYLLRLGHGLDFVGLIGSIVGLSFALFSLPAGIISRKWGGRRTMIAGFGTALLTCAVMPVAEFLPPRWSSGWLLVTSVARAAGFAMYWVNARPFLMSATGERERTHVYAVQSAVFPLTGFLGSLLAGLMPGGFATLLNVSLDHPAPYRYPLWIVAVLLLPGLAALASMREFSTEASHEPAGSRSAVPLGLIVLLSLCVFLQATGQGAMMAFYNVYLDDHLQVSTSTIGAISASAQLLSALFALGTPFLARRWGNSRVFVWASVGIACALLPLALIPHWGAAALGYLGVMALGGIALPAINVYQMELVSLAWRTAMSGSTAMVSGLNWSAAAFVGGHVIETWGYRPFYLLGAGLTLAGALLFRSYFGVPRGELAEGEKAAALDDAA
jgi:MFS family permease